MAIKERDGKFRTIIVPEDLDAMITTQLENFSPDELETIAHLVNEIKGDERAKLLDLISKAEYISPVVDMKTWLNDPYYLGETGKSIYPVWKDHLINMFDNGVFWEIYLTGAIGIGKCVDENTPIFDSNSGEWKTVRAVVAQKSPVATFDNGHIKPVAPDKWLNTGTKECLTIKTRTGREITVTPEHPLLTINGWVEARKLKKDDFIVMCAKVPNPSALTKMHIREVEALAVILSEGCCSQSPSMAFSTTDEDFFEMAKKAFEHCGFKIKHRSRCDYMIQQNGKTPVSWMKKFSIDGKLAKHKRVPSVVFSLNDNLLARFIEVFWAGDGYVSKAGLISITLASKGMIDDLNNLLLRFGVVSRKRHRDAKLNGKVFDAWELNVESWCREKFRDRFPNLPCSPKRKRLASVKPVQNANFDVVPIYGDVAERIKYIAETFSSNHGKGGNNFSLYSATGKSLGRKGKYRFHRLLNPNKGHCTVGRKVVSALIEQARGRLDWLKWSVSNDIYFDKITSIKEAGVRNVFDLSVSGTHNFIANGFVAHNTTIADIIIIRMLYELNCMRSPQMSYGLAPHTKLYFVHFSKTKFQARNVSFDDLSGMLNQSPYFQENSVYHSRKGQIHFERINTFVIPSTSDDSNILGLAVLGAEIDEANFIGDHTEDGSGEVISGAQKIRIALEERIRSRFLNKGNLPGKIITMSSKTMPGDYVDMRLLELASDPNVYVVDMAKWEATPEKYSKTTFPIFVSEDRRRTYILKNESEVDVALMRDKGFVVRAPIEFYKQATEDLVRFLQNVGGISTGALGRLFEDFIPVLNAVDKKPLPVAKEWDITVDDKFEKMNWDLLVRRNPETGDLEPIHDPVAPRVVGLDTSTTEDRTGIVVAHIERNIEVTRVSDEGFETKEMAPLIIVDFAVGIRPPDVGEIYFPTIRKFIYMMKARGINIAMAGMDSHQTVEYKQQFERKGIGVEIVSTVKDVEPYLRLRKAFREGRIKIPQNQILLDELECLIYDRKKQKIDHPAKGKRGERGSKDIADAVCVCVTLLETCNINPLIGFEEAAVIRKDLHRQEIIEKSGHYVSSVGNNNKDVTDIYFENFDNEE